MKEELKKLSKEQLIELAGSLLYWQENHYKAVQDKTRDIHSAFYQLAGNVQNIRRNYDLTLLYSDESK